MLKTRSRIIGVLINAERIIKTNIPTIAMLIVRSDIELNLLSRIIPRIKTIVNLKKGK
jgi:hypothetical protein